MSSADLVLRNARVITLDPSLPYASMIAVKGGRVLFAGDESGIDSAVGPGTKIIDCGGRTVVPGFNDAHCHLFSSLRKLLSVNLSPPGVRSIADIQAALRKKAAETPPGEWISGTEYNEFYLAEKRHPTRQEIDAAVPGHPVVLSHRSLHACVLNSRALERAGITRETPEPPGARIERDLESGEPNGLLFEMLGHIREKVMPSLSLPDLEMGMAVVSERCLAQGITSLQDATVVNDLDRWNKYARLTEQGILRPRLSMMPGIGFLRGFLDAGLGFGSGDSRLRLGAAKMVPREPPGPVYPPQEEFDRQVLEAHTAGFQVAVHAAAWETVEAAVHAFERAQVENPRSDHRHRLEHCSECPPRLLARLSKLQAVVATQPPFIYYSGERYLATVPEDRRPWLYRIRSLMDAGIVVAGSSDSPIVPDNPLDGIHAAVNRKTEAGQDLLPEEKISPLRALEMYTRNAAYAAFEEKEKGTLAPGMLADMALLSDDPLTVPPENIRDITVQMTILGGEVVREK